MIIDPVTLMFSDLSDEEAVELRTDTEAFISGALTTSAGLPAARPAWMEQWLAMAISSGIAESMGIVALSTIMPIRVFHSLLQRHDETTEPEKMPVDQLAIACVEQLPCALHTKVISKHETVELAHAWQRSQMKKNENPGQMVEIHASIMVGETIHLSDIKSTL